MPTFSRLLPLVLTALFGSSLAHGADDAFGSWPAGTAPREIGRRVADNLVARPHRYTGSLQVIHYAEVCTWYGALTFAQLTTDAPLTGQLVDRFAPLLADEAKRIPPSVNVDYAVFGTVPFELFLQTKDPRYLAIGLTSADGQWQPPADGTALRPVAQAAVAAGLSWHTRYWIDDMYMITMLQTQAFRATGDSRYLDRAAREAVAYLDSLQQPNGLFFHAPDAPYFWGRGNGWFAAGMSELLRSLPAEHPHHARILASYQKMMATLLRYQDADSMWHQLIDDATVWPETSATGMFTFAFITGVKNGWLDPALYAPAARKAWLALGTYVDAQGAVREVCEGTGKDSGRDYYLARKRITGDLHGQAPILWCASALLR